MSKWVKATFVIDSIPNNSFEGYTDGANWNGWACPFFDHDTAKRILRYCEDTANWNYDETNDIFVLVSKNDGETEEFRGQEIQYNGQTLPVFGIGTRSWIWEEAT